MIFIICFTILILYFRCQPPSLSPAGDELGVSCEVNIASADENADAIAVFDLHATVIALGGLPQDLPQTCQAQAASGLDHHLHSLTHKPHLLDELLIADCDDLVDVLLHDCEGQVADSSRLSSVGDRLGRRVEGHNLTLFH